MSQGASMEFLFSLAKALAAQFGSNCEVVVHDLTTNDPERSIAAIENGHVTGRSVGDGPSRVVLEALKGDPAALNDHLSYLTRTKDGKILKSSTVFLRDETGRPTAILGINYDITLMRSAADALNAFTRAEEGQREPEPIAQNVADLLDELLSRSARLVGKPPALMSKEDKVKAIRFLNDAGAFLITKSGDKACQFFGISKYTLYSYMDEAKEEKG